MERVERRKEDRGMEQRRVYKPGDAAREQAFGSGATAGTTVPSGAGGAEIPAGSGAESGSRGTAGTGGAGYTNPGGSTGRSSLKPDPNVGAPGTEGDHASSPVGKPGSRGIDKRSQGHMQGHAEEDVPNDAWPFKQEIKKP